MDITIDSETSEAIQSCLMIDRARLVEKRDALLQAIERKERLMHGGETARVAKSFHLGLVGGSGRAVKRLNKRREQEIDRLLAAINGRKKLAGKLGVVKARIARIDDGREYQDAVSREIRRQRKAMRTPAITRDSISRVRREMSSGDHFYRFQDGAEMRCFCVWDNAICEPAGFVVLSAQNSLFYLFRAKSIQGVDFGEASVDLARKYLNVPQNLLPAAGHFTSAAEVVIQHMGI